MAMENEILVGRYSRLLQKLLSMKGPVPSPQLAGDITAHLAMEVDRPEWGFLKEETLYMGQVTAAALAANLSAAAIFNGQATGALVVVTGIIINPTAATLSYTLSLGATTGITGTSHPFSTDMRWLGKSSTAAIGIIQEAARTGNIIANITIPANTPPVLLLLPTPIILPPNVSPTPVNGPPNLAVECTTANTQIQVNFFWRERQLEASEGPVPGA